MADNGGNGVYYLLGALVLAGAGWVLYAVFGGGEYDSAFCPLDGKHPRTAIIIDATDALDAAHRGELQAEMDGLRGRLALNEWLGLYVLDKSGLNLPKPLIALCNPGNKNTCNPAVANCAEAERVYRQDFAAPMAEQIQLLTARPEQEESPILEMLLAVVLDGHLDKSQKRRLIIVSDMLHNTAEYSHYRSAADFAAWQKTDYARRFLELPLGGAEVEIWYVKRPGAVNIQTREHVDFWRQYFNAVGAEVREIKPIAGPPNTGAAPKPAPQTRAAAPKNIPKPKPAPKAKAAAPRQKSAPKTAEPKPAPQTRRSPEEWADFYRKTYAQSGGKDYNTLRKLLLLYSKNAARADGKTRLMIMKNALQDGGFPPDMRLILADIALHAQGGFVEDKKTAYILLRCAGRENTAQIENLRRFLAGAVNEHGENVLQSADKIIFQKQRERICLP